MYSMKSLVFRWSCLSAANDFFNVSKRFYPIYADAYPNPMPYTSELFKKRFPHRMKNAWEVTHDEVCLDPLPSLEERLAGSKKPQPKMIDIGMPLHRQKVFHRDRLRVYRANKENFKLRKLQRECQLTLNLSEVSSDWENEGAPYDIRTIADHYDIFKDLFKYGFFQCVVPMNISYNNNQVFYGNRLNPEVTVEKPSVCITGDPTQLYTLLFVNLDGDICREEGEALLWVKANIKENSFDNSDDIVPYIQPFPFQGTGFHRCVFILFQHDQQLSMDEFKLESFSSIKNRSFKMFEFYCKHQDLITPVSLLFFQTQWDDTVTRVFHEYFGMREPIFEYNFEKAYLPKQVKYPANQPFNKYLDAYRDRRDINESVIKKYLKETCPFKGYPKQLKFPHAEAFEEWMPTWYRNELTDYRSRLRKWARVPY